MAEHTREVLVAHGNQGASVHHSLGVLVGVGGGGRGSRGGGG